MANTRRNRYQHFHPSSPADMFTASADAGMRSIEARLNQAKEEERMQQAKCSYCGKNGGDSLKSCSRCKAARYCNQTCQLADFKSRHKRECANFDNPPTTSAFLTKPVANERYPQQPVFAHGHADGVGCWVSVSGRIDCDLQPLGEELSPAAVEGSFEARQLQMFSNPEKGRDMVRRYRATAHSLLSLSLLVQNRRKETGAILVFASQAQVVSYGSTAAIIQGGTAEGDNMVTFTHDRVEYTAAGVAIDPWDKIPRLEITHFNGQEVKRKDLPAAVKDAKGGIIALNPGDYAMFRLQFRVGNGDNVSKDWQAIACCETIRVPYAVWDGVASPASLAPMLPLAQTPPPIPEGPGKSLRAAFKQRAVSEHYNDFIEHGEDAYMRAHFGDARADMARSADSMMTMMSEMVLGQVAQAGGTDVLVEHLREIGMGEIADKIAARDR